MSEVSPLLTSAEVATLMRIHPKQVYRLLARGLPAKRVGGKWLFERDAVLCWAGRGGQGSENIAPSPSEITPPLMAANGDLAIELLLGLARGDGRQCVGFVQADRDTGLALLQDRSVLAAGVHGDGHAAIPDSVDRGAWLHLVDREIGLVRRRGDFGSLAAMARVRWASRPPTAGVRAYLDAALDREGLDPARLHQRAILMPSHRSVVCAVARGDADVGLASRAWAAQVGLSFLPLLEEPYGLMVRASDLGRAEVLRLCETAQTRTFRRELGEIAGYQARRTGVLRFHAAA